MLKVSLIIPTKNEEKFIAQTIDSLLQQDYASDLFELLIVDGMSTDGTRKIVKEYEQKNRAIRLIDNRQSITPCAFNIGIKAASGDVVIFMGAHTHYSKNYISTVVKYLESGMADCVGSVAVTLPTNPSSQALSIALALSSPFGVGNSHMRIGVKTIRYTDTASCPGYRKDIFQKIGYFDESLIKNQDDELNLRLIRSGGRILLAPEITSYYYARDSFWRLWQMCYYYGYYKPRVVQKIGSVLTWRQLVPPVFVGCLIFSFILSFFSNSFFYIFLTVSSLYLVSNICAAILTGFKKQFFQFYLLASAYIIMHVGYGLGYLNGLCRILIKK